MLSYREELNKYKKDKKDDNTTNRARQKNKKKKNIIIEYKYIGQFSLFDRDRTWRTYRKYEKMKDAEEALKTLSKNNYYGRVNWEYRLKV
jgi:hypothetical protein|tara:strand:+ start:1775 stop:2044 length:270 start_codon:yes stop_codon:yes gene_type:complete